MRVLVVVAGLALGVALLGFLLGFGFDEMPEGDAGAPPDRGSTEVRLEGTGGTAPAPVPTPAAFPPPAPAAPGTLVVTCVEEGSTKAVRGVDVSVTWTEGLGFAVAPTDARGEAVFTERPAGTWRVGAEGAGWIASREVEASVEAGGTVRARLALVPAVPLEGIVVAARTGHPLDGAEVVVTAGGSLRGSLLLTDGRPWARVETDAYGVFRVPALPRAGIVTVTAHAPGYVAASVGVRPAEGGRLRVALEPGGRVRGIVRGPDGVVAGATVVLAPADAGEDPDPEEDGALTLTSDAEGRFVADGLLLDVPLAAQADAVGYAESAPVSLRLDGDAAEIVLRLPAAAIVTIRVADPEGRRLADVPAGVGFAPFFTGLLHAEGRTDADGRIRFEDLNLGRTMLRVEVPGFVPWRKRVTLKEGERRDVEVVLDPGVSITGHVVDDVGAPVEGATVHAEQSFIDSDAVATTDADGAFRLCGLVPKPACEIRAYRYGYAPSGGIEVEAPADDIRLVLPREGILRARLVLPPGVEAPPRQIIEVFQGRSSTMTEANWKDGVVRHALAPGTYRVALYGEGLQRVEHKATLAPGAIVDLGDVFLEPARHWRGVVVDEAGRPIPGATVIVIPDLLSPSTTDEEGHFSLPDPGSVPQTLAVKAEGYADLLEVIDRAPEGPLRLVLPKKE